MADYASIDVNGSSMRICWAAPPLRGPHPLVVLMCHIGGLDGFTEDRIDRLARAGYVAIAPDIFHYHPWIEDKTERRASLRDLRVLADVEAAISHARMHINARPGSLGIVGHCMGGRTALLAAGSIGDIGPLVIYYGGRTMLSWGEDQGPTPFERIPSVHGPVLGFFGQEDQEPSPADVERIESEFERHGTACEFHRFDDAGHAFQDFLSPTRYREQPARVSWDRTLEFLQAELAPQR
ncbi:MAG: dienelactone hydrolase family protein [Pseudomonadota bacterium]